MLVFVKLVGNGFTRPEFSRLRDIRLQTNFLEQNQSSLPTILVTMGATDPACLTLKVLRALDTLDQFKTNVLLGPGFKFL